MIDFKGEDYLGIVGENGANLDLDKVYINPKAVIQPSKNAVLRIDVNECERIELNKEDAIELAMMILKIVNEDNLELVGGVNVLE